MRTLVALVLMSTLLSSAAPLRAQTSKTLTVALGHEPDRVYTWQLMMNPQSGFDTTVEDKLKSVDKVDDHTVRFTYLSANEAHALDPERYKDQGNDPVVDPLYAFGLYDAPAIYPRHALRDIVGDDPRHSRLVAG